MMGWPGSGSAQLQECGRSGPRSFKLTPWPPISGESSSEWDASQRGPCHRATRGPMCSRVTTTRALLFSRPPCRAPDLGVELPSLPVPGIARHRPHTDPNLLCHLPHRQPLRPQMRDLSLDRHRDLPAADALAPRLRRRHPRPHPLPDHLALELGEAGTTSRRPGANWRASTRGFCLISAPVRGSITPCSEEAARPLEGLSPPHLPRTANLLSARLCGRRACS